MNLTNENIDKFLDFLRKFRDCSKKKQNQIILKMEKELKKHV